MSYKTLKESGVGLDPIWDFGCLDRSRKSPESHLRAYKSDTNLRQQVGLIQKVGGFAFYISNTLDNEVIPNIRFTKMAIETLDH